MSRTGDRTQVRWNRISGWSDICAHWSDEDAVKPASCFQSGMWLNSWVRLVAAQVPLYLLKVVDGDQIIAVGLFADQMGRNALHLPQRVGHLHRTGHHGLDCITVEYNGLLARPERHDTAIACLLQDFATRGGPAGWQCLDLPGLDAVHAQRVQALAEELGLRVVMQDEKPIYAVDLSALPPDQDYLGSLGKNTRHQIRRSLKLFQAMGPLRFEEAKTTEQAGAYFERLEVLHQAHWRARGQPGAFASPFFREYHRDLISSRLGRGEISLARITAGKTEIGYLYNFKFNDIVYNYQSGFVEVEDAKLKPGFVSHYLAIEDARAHGFSLYDFMAGEAGHKARLGKPSGQMRWLRLQRRHIVQEAEYFGRKLKNWLRPLPSSD